MMLRRLASLFAFCSVAAAAPAGADTVVLLHGLGRGSASMLLLKRDLARQGYAVVSLAYPSRREPLASLAESTLDPVFADPALRPGSVHIVTHSMGGMLVRQYLRDHGAPAALGRVVMLAPPNQGSEIVDRLGDWWFFGVINGPAGRDLGTAPHHAPVRLGPPPPGVSIGVIAGSFSWNPLYSSLIPGPDDGKVSVARTHLAGEADHLELPYSHTWLMNRAETRRQIAAFLRTGRFER